VNTIKHYGNTVCALTGFDVLVYVKLSWHLKQCHISIKNVIVERMTVVINMHKPHFIFMTCHVMIIKVWCQSYAHPLCCVINMCLKQVYIIVKDTYKVWPALD